jgi:hypothetical protein
MIAAPTQASVTERPVVLPPVIGQGESAIPIGQFLNGENFDPETTHVMGVALEIACVALQLRNRNDPADIAMAVEKIIAITPRGV